MVSKQKLSVIISCFNEEGNIKRYDKELLPVLRSLKMPFEVVLVDDGSKDNTVKEIKKLLRRNRNVKLVTHPRNLGLGAGMKTGIRHAAGDLAVFLDADLTFHPKEIPKLLERFKRGDVDCVIGSHFSRGGRLENVPFYRFFLSKGVNTIYSILLGRRISSISSILRLYKTAQLKEVTITSNNFDANAEILFKLIQRKRRIAEVPVTLTTRRFGVSKLNNAKEIKNHLKMLSKVLLWKLGLKR
jgi:dolichol-phosphate mannosyltransferase